MSLAPVAFFVFNRPRQTARVFDSIKLYRPKILLLISDGPRRAKAGDAELCNEVLEIISQVDWPCQVFTNYSDENLGCKIRVSSGLDWVFSVVDRAIILEDDCLPDTSFYHFCEELLEYYKNDQRVMQICGSNFYPSPMPKYSYSFSKFGPIWGWASWRRAWSLYDVTMQDWHKVREEQLYYNFWEVPCESEFRLQLYEDVYVGKVDTWDLQWSFAKFINSGLCIMPSVNLISNIGFGDDATHTKDESNELANIRVKTMKFPLDHYPLVTRDWETDARISQKTGPAYWQKSRYKKRMEAHPHEFLTSEGYSEEIKWNTRENTTCACGCSIMKFSIENHMYKVCRDCGSYVLSQVIVEEQLGLLYGRAYWYEHQTAIGNPQIEQRYNDDIKDRIPHWIGKITKLKAPPASIIEIGCGHGRLLQELSKLGYKVTGVEYSDEIASVAKSLSKIPVVSVLPESKFDIVIANDVLEHVYDPILFLSSIAERLTEEGRLFTQVPTTLIENAISKALRPYYHTYIYSEECLNTLAEKASMEIESITHGMFDCFDIIWKRSVILNSNLFDDIITNKYNKAGTHKSKLKAYLRDICQKIIQKYLS